MNDNIYVTGHRHPDSDSICAAITYTDLLNRTNRKAVACRQGPLNEETKFILKRFNQENPLLMTDARARLMDIDLDKPTMISGDETVHHAWHVMLATQNRSLFVVDDDEKLIGICTTSDLSRVRTHPDTDLNELMSTASLANIAKTIGGRIIVKPNEFKCSGAVHVITLDGKEAAMYELNEGISILSSGEEKLLMLIEMGCKCIVITCNQQAPDSVINAAIAHDCAIIETENDTMHTARIITESYSIKEIMSRDLISFKATEYVDDVDKKMANSRVRAYPVLDDNGKVIGSLSRLHIRNAGKLKIALVDHSAMNQTIKNLDMAYLTAIIDHHHIGNVQTDHPIEYRNHKCGCTCTIIATLYQENGLLPDKDMSGLLLSAIISDTLNFKSATTTEEDKITAQWLAQRAGIDDINEYAREMLGASVALKDSTPHEILNRDLKTYDIGKYRFAIGQTNYSYVGEVQKLLPEFKLNLEKEAASNHLDLMVMLFTDVMGLGSFFVYYGPLSYVLSDVIETKFDDHSGYDPKIISRKQQLMPKLSQIIAQI